MDPASLWHEIREAEDQNTHYIGADYDTENQRYAGPGYRKDWNVEPDPENHSFEWYSLFAPLLLSGNPRVKTRSRKQGTFQDLARAMEMALNRNIRDTEMRELNEKLFYDFGQREAIAITYPEPGEFWTEIGDIVYRPVSSRISPKDFLSDAVSIERSKDRWRGHKVIRDKKSILKQAEEHPEQEWNLHLLEGIGEDAFDKTSRDKKVNVRRGEVVYVEIWVPEHQLDEAKDSKGRTFKPTREKGFNGTIFTLPMNDVQTNPTTRERGAPDRYLRAPRPFYGPAEGPYTIIGAYIVPNMTRSLSPLAATRAQQDELNEHRNAGSRAMSMYKKGIAVDSTAGNDLEEKIVNFQDQGVFSLEGVEEIGRHIAPIEVGGLTQQALLHLQFLRDSLDRNSGISDAQRGNVSTDTTATAIATANQSSSRRAGYLAMKFIKGLESILMKEAWYMLYDERFKKNLGPESANQFADEEGNLIQVPVLYQGGGDPKEMLHEDFELEIDLYSVSQTSEEMERLKSQERLNLAVTVLPMIAQVPWFDWETWLQEEGSRSGDYMLGSLVDVEMARTIGMLQLMAQLGGEVPQGGFTQPPQHRTMRDILPAGASPKGFVKNARLQQTMQSGASMSHSNSTPQKESSDA